jgi:hypothetical protein
VGSFGAKDWTIFSKRGCPTDTLANARLWRKAHTPRRASTHPKQIAQQVAEELDDDSQVARERRAEYLAERPEGSPLPSTDLKEPLIHSIELEGEAYRMVHQAMTPGVEDPDSTRSPRKIAGK